LVLDEHNRIKDVQVHQLVLRSEAFCAGNKGARPDTYQVTVKNNFATMLIVKCLLGPTCVLEDGTLNSLKGTALHTLLIDPVARFMEKCCTPAGNTNAELVAEDVLSRSALAFKKNMQDKVVKHGCWNNQFCLRILHDIAFAHTFTDREICKGVQVEHVLFFLRHTPKVMTWYQKHIKNKNAPLCLATEANTLAMWRSNCEGPPLAPILAAPAAGVIGAAAAAVSAGAGAPVAP